MKKLKDYYKIASGGTPKTTIREYYEGGNIPWVKTGDLKVRELKEIPNKITELGLKNSSAKIFPKNTVLLAMYGATIGNSSILKTEAATNQACAAFLPNDRVDYNFIYFYLRSIKQFLIRKGVGGGQPNISAKILKEIKVNFPTLEDQKRIAQVLTDCETLITRRKESITLLDELVNSTFLEMFGDPLKNEMGWKTTQLKNLGDFKNGLNFSKNEKGHTIKSLGVREFKRLSTIYETKSLPTINVMKYPSKDYFLKNGDLVFVRSNGNRKLVGRCIAIYPNDENVTFSGFCIRFRPESKKLNSIYLTYLFKIESFKNRMLSKGRGANITNLNQTILGNLKILLPPIDTQKHFEHKVHKIESLIRLQKQHLKQLQNLYGRLSQDAFKGELDLSKVVLREEFLQEAIKKETSEKSEPTYDQKTLFNIKKIDTYFEHFLKNNFQEKSFVFEDVKALLFEDIRTQYNQYDYDKWKKQFFNILNKKNSFIEQYFEEEEGALKFKLKHETD